MLDTFDKSKVQFKVEPNLKDYESKYKYFTWEKEGKEVIEWFDDGRINAAYNAIDRHLKTHLRTKTALIWEGTNGEKKTYTFEDLAKMSNKFGNLLKSHEVVKGDRVFLFLPRIAYLYFSFI